MRDLTRLPVCFVRSVAVLVSLLATASAAQQNEVQKLATGDLDFGPSVALSGDTAIVGATGDTTDNVYVYSRLNGIWFQQQVLVRGGGGFGASAALHGNTAVIGSPFDGAALSGAVYVYTRPAAYGFFTEQQQLTPSDGEFTDFFGTSVSLDADTVLIGSPFDDDQSGSAYVYVRSGGAWSLQSKLTASDGAAGLYFGDRVALSGDTALVCSGGIYGSVYVFARTGIVWTQQQKLMASDRELGDDFGSSLALSGDLALIGAPGDDDRGTNTGAVYEFVRSGGVWTQLNKLTASDAASGDGFGSDVSLSGEIAGIGATGAHRSYALVRVGGSWVEERLIPSDGAPGLSPERVAASGCTVLVGAVSDFSVPGACYIFDVPGAPLEVPRLVASDRALADFFGTSASLSGDTAVVGSPLDDDRGADSGSAYVFVRTSGVWAQRQKLVPSDGAAGDGFGQSVALSGNVLVVGAPLDDGGRGSAYVYVRAGNGDWLEAQKLTASDGVANDRFGWSVAVSGSTLVVGASLGDGAAVNSGAAYVFVDSGFAWTQEQKLIASDGASNDQFGFAVSVSGDDVLVGAHKDDDRGTDSGSAYVFVRSRTVWTQQQKLVARDGARDDWFGYSVAQVGDLAVIGADRGDGVVADSGSAYVFVRSGGAWAQQQELSADDGALLDRFGSNVSVSGSNVVIGSPGNDERGTGSGAAYAYVRVNGVWTQQQKLTLATGAVFDALGASVSVSGNDVLVGAPLRDNCALDTGEAYVFRIVCRTVPYGAGCGGAVLSAGNDNSTPTNYTLSLWDSSAIAVAAIAFGDQRASFPFPPDCTVLNNLLFAVPASIHPFEPKLATLRFRPPAIPGLVFQVQGVAGLTSGWLALSNGIEFICP